MPSDFIVTRATKLIEIGNLVASEKDTVNARFEYLMEHPEDRDPDIMRNAVGYLVERYADETGSEDAAAEYAADLASFAVQPFSAIASVPLPVRGVLHSTGAALVSAICARQAWLESVGIGALEIADKMGKENKSAAARMNTAQKKQMSKDGGLKKTLAQMSAAQKQKSDA